MSVRITAAERDALYEQIVVRLSGIDEVWIAVGAGDFARADKVGREFGDYLRLIGDDLGWGEGGGEALELTTPPGGSVPRLRPNANPSRRGTREAGSGAGRGAGARGAHAAGPQHLPAGAEELAFRKLALVQPARALATTTAMMT